MTTHETIEIDSLEAPNRPKLTVLDPPGLYLAEFACDGQHRTMIATYACFAAVTAMSTCNRWHTQIIQHYCGFRLGS